MAYHSVMGLLFSNMHDEVLPEFTGIRAIGSVPFGGRYRLIDFTLSNMVNAGVSKVGVITKSNYQSLMDHLGSGKAWDLSRKNEGLYFLPPFGTSDEQYEGRVASLAGILPFLLNSKEDYVILSDCHIVGNINYRKLVEAHVESGADITVACVDGTVPHNIPSPVVKTDDSGRITELLLTDHADDTVTYGIGLYVMSRNRLLRFLDEATSRNQMHFERDILQRHVEDRRLFVYKIPEYLRVISSLSSYVDANRDLLDASVRKQLFLNKRPIYTKVRDTEPALYGLHAKVSGSLIADGCKIEGTVENSILFRNVQVERHATVRNCIIMQGSLIGGQTDLEYIITDKNVRIRNGKTLKGCADYPIAVRKHTTI